jgi:hypothetical protein
MLRSVQSTVNIDDDLVELLHDRARRTGRTFRDVANEAIREGLLLGDSEAPCVPPVHDLGIRPGVDLANALQLVGQFEDEEVVRKMAIGI